jgi:hypothetical protein
MRRAASFAVVSLLCALGAGRAAAQSDPERLQSVMSAVAAEAGLAPPVEAAAPVPPTPTAAPVLPRPYVVIFDGPSVCDGCQTPFEDYFRARGYDVREVKPGESTPELLAGAVVYVAPGGDDVTRLSDAWTAADREAIRDYVRRGGRYYGVCLGGYWAGKAGTWPGTVPGFEGLDMLPAVVLELSADDKGDKIVGVHWDGAPREAYFQDGPTFALTDDSRVIKVYATYDADRTPGHVAAFSARYGRGKVAVSGVHTEAAQDWYDEAHLPAPPNLDRDMLEEILGDLLEGSAVL